MVRSKLTLILIFVISISSVSCSSTRSATPTAQVTENVPTSPVLPTNTSVIQPTGTAAAQPTNTPTTPGEKTAVPTTNPEPFMPNGIATYLSDSSSVKYFDLQGNPLGELPAANIGITLFPQAVIEGAQSDSTLPPVVYFIPPPSAQLWLSEEGRNIKLADAPNLLHLYAAPGKPVIAYTLAQYTDNGLRSLVYLGDIQAFPSDQPVMDNTSTESYAIKPMAISFSNNQPVAFWFTNVPNGIGGDIVFEPRRGLNYYDMVTNEIKSYLDMVTTPLGISPDQTWVAYQYAEGVSPISIAHNFDFSSAITFPLRDDSVRGAGDAYFSPANQYVAWREVGGYLSGTPTPIHTVIRIAKIDGSILAEVPDTAFLSASGFSGLNGIIPVGWLDTQTFAVQVFGINQEQAVLSVKFDGSQISVLAPGAFVGFLYP